MAFVYLIGERGNDTNFKIGVTKKKDIQERLKELQTGNSEELYLRSFFETKYPYKLEALLHTYYKSKNILNEWYVLDKSDIDSFQNLCLEKEKMFDSLVDNPFFNPNSKNEPIDFLI